MKKFKTNKLKSKCNYKNINNKFDFYEIETDEVYLSYGASCLDEIDNDRICSIAFNGGKQFYTMSKKGEISLEEITLKARDSKEGHHLKVREIIFEEIPENLQIQIFFNYLSNYDYGDSLRYDNITGKLIVYRAENIKKKDDKIKHIKCLNIFVDRNNNLQMSATMFREYKRGDKSARYRFAEDARTIKRIRYKDRDDKRDLVLKGYANKKTNISFFDMSSYDKFIDTKVGILYEILDEFEKRFSEYIKLESVDYEIDRFLEKKSNERKGFEEIFHEKLREKGLNIVDRTNDKSSDYFIDILVEYCNEILDSEGNNFCYAVKSDELDKDKYNLRYIHNRKYYEERELKDPYKDEEIEGKIVQHITVEDFFPKSDEKKESKDSVKKGIKSLTGVILKELVIKGDLKESCISTYDWKELGFKDDFIITHVIKENKNDLGTFYHMTIQPDGKYRIEGLDIGEALEKYPDHARHFVFEKSIDIDNNTIFTVEDSEGNINIVRETNMFTLPQFKEYGNYMKKASQKLELEADFLLKEIDKVLLKTESPAAKDGLNMMKEEIESNLELDSPKLVYNSNEIKGLKGSRRNAHKELTEHIYENYDEVLYLYSRDPQIKENFLKGILDINYVQKDENSAYYSVGTIGDGMQNSVERASLIRKVYTDGKSELIFDKIINLMNVCFVRYGQLTVYPFPLKYIREYHYIRKRKQNK